MSDAIPNKHAGLAEVRLVDLPSFARADGTVVALEAPLVPFEVARVFSVTAQAGAVRGRHAHKACSQLMYCPNGTVEAIVDDGAAPVVFQLEGGKTALLVPPGLWLELLWRTEGAVLTVLCDQRFDEADYLRDREQFLAWRRAGGGEAQP